MHFIMDSDASLHAYEHTLTPTQIATSNTVIQGDGWLSVLGSR